MLPRAKPSLEEIGGEDILTLLIEGKEFHFALVPGGRAMLGKQCHYQKPHKHKNVVELRRI